MVTSQTWGRRRLFLSEEWAKLFLDTLYNYRPSAGLERAVQFIKGGFSHRAKKELGSNMEVWQKGFSDHRIRQAADFAMHVDYIRQNPVRKHLCAKSEDYPYSSAFPGFAVDPVPQGLKPRSSAAVAVGAAEAVPLQISIKKGSTDA